MKILIVEDDFISRKLMLAFLAKYGECDVAVNGAEAVEAFLLASEAGEGYDLITLDIMMPEMNGQEALKRIRLIEKERALDATKIIMTTALKDSGSILEAFSSQCEGYLVKPIELEKLLKLLSELGLIDGQLPLP